jgi:holliday junction DNA helicase RuvB
VQLHLPPFTLIGATTRMGLLTAPLRGRFGFTAHLDFYPPEDLCLLLRRSAVLLRVVLDPAGEMVIARCSRGTPRVANRLLRRVRDFAEVHDIETITAEVARDALALLKIDDHGLHDMDRRILETVVHKFGGGPVGLSTIAAVLGEEEDTVEDLLEPFLIQQGLIERTRRGREATPRAYEILGIELREGQNRLF